MKKPKNQQAAVNIPKLDADACIETLRARWNEKLEQRKAKKDDVLKNIPAAELTDELIADYDEWISEPAAFHTVQTNADFQKNVWFGCDVTLERIEKAIREHGAWDLKDCQDAPAFHTIGIKLDNIFHAIDISL